MSYKDLCLPDAQRKLYSLSSCLEIDAHIKKDFDENIDKIIQEAKEFQQGFKVNAEKVYIHGELVKRAQSARDVNVSSLEKALSVMRSWFKSSKDQVHVLQFQVNKQIENCRGQLKKHRNEQDMKKIHVEDSKYKIKELKQTIELNKEEAREMDRKARELDYEVVKLKEEAEINAKAGLLGSAAQFLAGALLAPVSGGTSLLLCATGATTLGVTIKVVADKENEAKECRNMAEHKRISATNLREDVSKMEGNIHSLQGDIERLQKRIDKLKKALKALQDVVTVLKSSDGFFDAVILAIQDMESSLKELSLHGSSFDVARKSGREKIVGDQLEKLKESYEKVIQTMYKDSDRPRSLVVLQIRHSFQELSSQISRPGRWFYIGLLFCLFSIFLAFWF